LEEKLAVQKQIRALESQRNDKRRALFDAQDAVDQQRDTLIAQIEGKLSQQITTQPVFLLRWSLL
jgi:adenine-specific DNA-methyltransferase